MHIIKYIINHLSAYHNNKDVNQLLEPIEDYLHKYFDEIKKICYPLIHNINILFFLFILFI